MMNSMPTMQHVPEMYFVPHFSHFRLLNLKPWLRICCYAAILLCHMWKCECKYAFNKWVGLQFCTLSETKPCWRQTCPVGGIDCYFMDILMELLVGPNFRKESIHGCGCFPQCLGWDSPASVKEMAGSKDTAGSPKAMPGCGQRNRSHTGCCVRFPHGGQHLVTWGGSKRKASADVTAAGAGLKPDITSWQLISGFTTNTSAWRGWVGG